MKQGGFTIVELLVVLGIVAILAVIAIPVYQNYTVRARVTEGLAFATAAQLAVADTVATHGRLPLSQAETNYLSPAPTDNVESVTIADDGSGTVIIDYTPAAGDGTIIFLPTLDATNNIYWICTGGTLETRYRPINCR
ncbi:pilin [Legionella yabuuchiae]|uniref:pilin n=1 Tax=Legionella yabuuchiae TaxID=376727 RepID=UPI0010556652|nr:pilin [Legionella yabuuchiae]